MKGKASAAALGLLLVATVASLHSADVSRATGATAGPSATDVALEEIGSLSRLLFELAAERNAAISNRNETWILTVHQGRTVRKFTDKKYTIISLPIVQPTDRIALCRYAAQYNVFNLRAADHMVLAGEYKEATELYRLVLHFDRCGDAIVRERTEKKIQYVGKLERGEAVEETLKRFSELYEELGAAVDFSQLDKLPPKVVTNLFEVRLP